MIHLSVILNRIKNKKGIIKFKKLKCMAGYLETFENYYEIVLDPTKDIIPSLIHEYCHLAFPDKLEKEVVEMERLIVRSLSACQLKHLLIKLVGKL